MQRINKNTLAGNLVIDGVLNTAWSIEEGRYEGNIYYGLLNEESKGNLRTLFLKEQGNKCCYCLKEITQEEITIEHIIPQKVSEEEFNSYLTVPELSTQVIHKNAFDRSTLNIPPERYPHDLGYNNLIASCDSSTHCNNKRGNAFISPFMYDDTLLQDISYEPFGSVFTTTTEIDALKLNNDFLKMVRRLWHLIAKKIDTLDEILNQNTLQNILDELIINEGEKYIETFTGETSKVSEVYRYKWFFNYYKLNNN